MTDGSKRDWRFAGCTALLAALVAFPLGMMFAADDRAREGSAQSTAAKAPAGRQTGRDFYSPNIAGDPYVLEQQLKVVEALERSCAQLAKYCEEARQARQRIEEQR